MGKHDKVRFRRRHIVFIGPPGAGKTKVGKTLKELTGLDFIDIDDVIVSRSCEDTLCRILEALGDEEFVDFEGQIAEEVLDGLTKPTIIATGGSIVYSDAAMCRFQEAGFIIYLKASLEKIERNVPNPPERGVVMRGSSSLEELLAERHLLYERYSNLTVDADGNRKEIARHIKKQLEKLHLV